MNNFNMNFEQRVVLNSNELAWQTSPSSKVLRRPLARAAAEHGHVTSIVKYQAGAQFPSHFHPFGEEILVLEGTLSDEYGDYPKGTYLRNPDGSHHRPYSESGCLLLVKLHQFQLGDDSSHVIDTQAEPWLAGSGRLKVMPLHQYGNESTALVFWPAGEKFTLHQHPGGEEIYVITGELIDEFGRYPQGTWLRNPPGSQHQPYVEQDTLIFVKTGHLSSV